MEKKAPDSSESGLGLVRSAFGNGPPPAFGSSVFGSPTDAGTGFGATTFGGASASEGASGSPSKPLFGSSLEGASKSPPNKPLSGNSFGQLSSPKAGTSAKPSAATAATPGESKASNEQKFSPILAEGDVPSGPFRGMPRDAALDALNKAFIRDIKKFTEEVKPNSVDLSSCMRQYLGMAAEIKGM
eukprot:m.276638 g.276638  ORF g.276638 m.276638 type:complete len:186 (-) comp16303_c0_seq2:150-707(-)